MRIFFDVVGCRLNQSEVEGLANIFRALGHQIVGESSHADLAIINTCAVTVKAAADSRKKIRHVGRSGSPRVIATGCWATLNPKDAMALPGVTDVFTNEEKDFIPAEVLQIDPEVVRGLTLVRVPLPGARGRTRAFIKVQEGCDNHCTYCLTRVARGKSRSRELDEVKIHIHAAAAGGAKEVVLTGVQLGAWGRDMTPSQGLVDLLEFILKMGGFHRLRLSSIEPWDFPIEAMKLWEDSRLCRHLHIPLQSGHDAILRKMRRPCSTGQYIDLIHTIREAVPDMAISTDIITGFPGETEEDFKNTKNLIHKLNFSSGHVFTFSPRPGTEAFHLRPRVPVKIAKARNAALREVFKESGHHYRNRFIGKHVPVLWESHQDSSDGRLQLSGLTDTYIRVYSFSEKCYGNEISMVKLEAHHSHRDALIGQIVD